MKRSAGLLLWRRDGGDRLEVLLGHPGGPLFARKDEGVWSIPKGEHPPDEDAFAAAHREFVEEVGVAPPDVEPLPLGEVRLRSGKLVTAWALEGEIDLAAFRSDPFTMEWPPRSGRLQSYPELDRVQWFDLDEARRRLAPGQRPLLDRLEERLAAPPDAVAGA